MEKFILSNRDRLAFTFDLNGITLTGKEYPGANFSQPEIFIQHADLPAVITWMQKALEEKLAEKGKTEILEKPLKKY